MNVKTSLLYLQRSWIAFTSLVILISAASIHSCWIRPLEADINVIKRRTAELNQRAPQTRESSSSLRQSRSLLAEEEQRLQQFLGALPDSPADIRREFLHWETASLVGVRWSKPSPGTATGPWSIWRLPVELRCEYRDLRDFLGQLGTLSQLVGVTECDIETSREAENLIKARVVLEIPVRPQAGKERGTQ